LPGLAERAVNVCVHHPHPSDENAASEGSISTREYDPAAAITSSGPSIDDSRCQEQLSEGVARQIPGVISSPTSHLPSLKVTVSAGCSSTLAADPSGDGQPGERESPKCRRQTGSGPLGLGGRDDEHGRLLGHGPLREQPQPPAVVLGAPLRIEQHLQRRV
jgi:hypothetical protein